MTDRLQRPRDTNQLAKFIVDLASGEDVPKKAGGQQRGGQKGGEARAEKLTPEERSAVAQKAAKARWSG